MFNKIIIFVMILFLSACKAPDNKKNNLSKQVITKGPITEKVNLDDFSNVIYVTGEAKGKGDGTKDKPFNSIVEALKNAVGKSKTAILVAQGIYEESRLEVKAGTEMFGGHCSKFIERDIEKHTTTISGLKKNRIMTLADDTRIDGFTLMQGQIRGKGGAIFTTAKNVTVSNNVISGNKTLRPVPWNPKFWHETANDGGAVYCRDGAEITIVNNIFTKNVTENGRGGAIAADDKCYLKITDNVFFNNIAGTEDPMRSSDGGAISIFRWSNADIENNLILSNTALTHNDAGGIWVALWSSANIKNNILVDSEAGDDAGAIFVGGQEHRYDAPLDPIPPKDKFFVSISGNTIIGNRNSSMNSGAMRFTMESRGEFIDNISVQNNGIYFQRSEAYIAGNTILDNFLLIETKEGLNPCIVKDNIIWGNYTQEIDAEVVNNNMKYPPVESKNYSKTPKFSKDVLHLDLASANYFPKKSYTKLTLLKKRLTEGELVDRVVKAGEKWSVVKYNDSDSIELWGNFAGEISVTVLPTYKVIN